MAKIAPTAHNHTNYDHTSGIQYEGGTSVTLPLDRLGSYLHRSACLLAYLALVQAAAPSA